METIVTSEPADLDVIFRLYGIATAFQQSKGMVQWPQFDRQMVETEIREMRQWKLIIEDQIACVWATTFSDPHIWEERNNDHAVYIHRIATEPVFRGRNLVNEIITWAKAYAITHGKRYIRLDTVGNNEGLIKHYTKCGFEFLGLKQLKNTKGLPGHYHNATVSLFELEV